MRDIHILTLCNMIAINTIIVRPVCDTLVAAPRAIPSAEIIIIIHGNTVIGEIWPIVLAFKASRK